MRESADESSEDLQPSMLPEEVVEKFINWYLSKFKMDLRTGSLGKNKYLSEEFFHAIQNQLIDDNMKSVLIQLGETKPSRVLIKEALISDVHSQVIVQTSPDVKMQVELQSKHGEWKITNVISLAKR